MPDAPPESGRRRAPGRLELALLTLRLNARTIGWSAGLLTITLVLGAIGILQAVEDGDPVTRTGTVVEVPSSQSIHVRVRLGTGDEVLVPRSGGARLAEGDRVRVRESVSALSTVGYRLVEAGGPEARTGPSRSARRHRARTRTRPRWHTVRRSGSPVVR